MSKQVVIEGYALKQKRRKGQGMARRWFRLDDSGLLSYYTSVPKPNNGRDKPRDSCSVSSASIGLSANLRELVIDTGASVWKIQFLSAQDYEQWLSALRAYRAKFTEYQQRRRSQSQSRQSSRASFHRALATESQAAQTEWKKAVDALDQPLNDLDALIQELSSSKDASPGHEHAGQSKFLHMFQRKPHEEPKPGATVQPADQKGVHKLQQVASTLRDHQQHLRSLSGRSVADFRRLSSDTLPKPLQEEALPEERESNASLDDDHHHDEFDDTEGDPLSRAGSVYYDAPPVEYDLDATADEDTHESLQNTSSLQRPDQHDVDDDASSSQEEHEQDLPAYQHAGHVQHRTKLPTGVSGGNVSIMSILRRNVGKDLSRIAMPVDFNEPLSALQKRCEELQYTRLLREAANAESHAWQLANVCAYVASGFATAKDRIMRKPFNPLLGETFECFRPDVGMEYFAEKVQHHPPVLLCHARDPNSIWEFDGSIGAKERFLGRSFEIEPKESNVLRFPSSAVTVSWTKPFAYVRNLMGGTKYIEYIGPMTVKASNGWTAELDFKEGSTWGGASSRNKVQGKVWNAEGEESALLSGRWDESIFMEDLSNHRSTEVWHIDSQASTDPAEYYGFTPFGIQLNEITPDLEGNLPPTDSRLRPDQRALEDGDVPKAEDLKAKLEDNQRSRRSQIEKESIAPEWFSSAGEDQWKFDRDAYMQAREKRVWDSRLNIFEV